MCGLRAKVDILERKKVMEKNKKGIAIYIILGILVVISIVIAVLFTRKSDVSYIKEHSGLELAGKYASTKENKRNSGIRVVKYEIKQSELESVRSYIDSNWKDGRDLENSMHPKDPVTDIDKEVSEDARYCTVYDFFWTPDTGAKTAEMQAFVVDKSDSMYIAFVGLDY